jgi:hypothetical protein
MRTIIAGSRDCRSMKAVLHAVANCGWSITVVLSGAARGADTLGENWAEDHDIPVERFPAEWETRGKGAGFFRNAQMANKADALIALWDGKSRGTEHMIRCAKARNLKIFVLNFREFQL